MISNTEISDDDSIFRTEWMSTICTGCVNINKSILVLFPHNAFWVVFISGIHLPVIKYVLINTSIVVYVADQMCFSVERMLSTKCVENIII